MFTNNIRSVKYFLKSWKPIWLYCHFFINLIFFNSDWTNILFVRFSLSFIITSTKISRRFYEISWLSTASIWRPDFRSPITFLTSSDPERTESSSLTSIHSESQRIRSSFRGRKFRSSIRHFQKSILGNKKFKFFDQGY